MRTTSARTVAAFALFAAAAFLVRGTLVAICWSCLIAVSTWPLHERVERSLGPRGRAFSAALLATIAVLALLVPLAYLVFEGLREMPVLLKLWASSNDAGLPAPAWLARIPRIGAWAAARWNAQFADPGALRELVNGWSARLDLHAGRGLLLEFGHRAMSAFFCILVLYFLYLHGDRLSAQFQVIVRRYLGGSGVRTTRIAVETVRQTVNGLLLVGLGLAAVMSVAYAVAGLPHATLWGLATGLLGIVPFGAGLVLAAASAALLVMEQTTPAIVLLLFGAVLIFITDHFVRPLLISGPTRIPLVLALLGIVGGLETLGILGLFVGPTLLAITVVVWRELAAQAARQLAEGERAGDDEPETRPVRASAVVENLPPRPGSRR